MNCIKSLLLSCFMLIIFLLLSCVDNKSDDVYSDCFLDVHASINTNTKTPIYYQDFPLNSSIGICCVGEDGINYDNIRGGFQNIKYSLKNKNTGDSWLSDNPINLSGKEAFITAYYPYNDSISDFRKLHISNTTQTDILVAGKVNHISSRKNKANLLFSHIMTGIRVKIKRGDYSKTGYISRISFLSNAITESANYNAFNGDFYNYTKSNEMFLNTGKTLEDELNVCDFLAIPTNIKDDIKIYVVVDGVKLCSKIPQKTALQSGNIYSITLTLNDGTLHEFECDIEDWDDDVQYVPV